jgi:hypothetical protein
MRFAKMAFPDAFARLSCVNRSAQIGPLLNPGTRTGPGPNPTTAVRATGAFVAALTLATGTARASAAATANAARGFSRRILN